MRREGKRCDARCHTATTSHCSCWCQGAYHGVGQLEAARRLCRDLDLDFDRMRRLGFPGVSDPRDHGPLFNRPVPPRAEGLLERAAQFCREKGLIPMKTRKSR